MMDERKPLLRVEDLAVSFRTRGGTVDAVRGISFDLHRGETLGIVGESGSGKSVTSYALMRILDRAGHIAAGSAHFGGMSLLDAPEHVIADMRGREMSMIFQNPRAALNPIRRVGQQIEDVLLRHAQATRAQVRERAIEALRKVRIRDPQARYDAYPFELSGGMCQRVVIAIALACRPQLLIADEPTTGLDVTTQRAVMELVRELTRSEGMSTLLITHDLGLAGEFCDRIVVMQKGRIVESGAAATLFAAPGQAYTQRLIRATPHGAESVRDLLPIAAPADTTRDADPPTEPPQSDAPALGKLLEVQELRKVYPAARSWRSLFTRARPEGFTAVKGISFDVAAGESVGLVGESGCGKSTSSSMVMRLIEPTSGAIRFQGRDISLYRPAQFARMSARARMQMVFQDASDSLNPRASAAESIADPLISLLGMRGATTIRARVEALSTQVGLPLDLLERYPHQLSGGQKARVGIARAIASSPDLLVLDEPTAALDVTVQAVVLNLLVELRRTTGMAYLFVSHDLEVVRLLCDRIIVMRAGEIVEQGPTRRILHSPEHAYTRALLAAAPRPPQGARRDSISVEAT